MLLLPATAMSIMMSGRGTVEVGKQPGAVEARTYVAESLREAWRV